MLGIATIVPMFCGIPNSPAWEELLLSTTRSWWFSVISVDICKGDGLPPFPQESTLAWVLWMFAPSSR